MAVFEDLTFCVSGTFSRSQQDMKDLITDNGGSIAATVNNSVYLVASALGTGKAAQAEKKGTMIVTEAWLEKAVKDQTLPTDKSLFLFGAPGGGGSAMDDSSDTKDDKPAKKVPAGRGRKRKAAEDDEEADEKDDSSSSSGGKVFAGLTFCVSGKLNRSQAATEKLIKTNGGGIAQSVTKAVTHVLAANADTGKAAKAAEKGLPVVTDEWLDKSIADGKLSTEASHFLSQPGSSSSSSSAMDQKDDADDDDGGDEPPSKKAKTSRTKATPKPKAKAKGKGKAKAKAADDDAEDDAGESKETKDDKGDMDTAGDDKDDEPSSVKTVLVKGKAPVDEVSGLASSYHVYCEGNDVYDAMLNQTNIGNNNNKFYIIQLLQADSGNKYLVWNRWGRVGATGQNSRRETNNLSQAKADFCSKFKDKTKNSWENRSNFKPVSGKYTLLERDYSADDAEPAEEDKSGKGEKKNIESKLDPRIQDVLKLICDTKMMDKQMMEVGYDAKKLPLGKLSKAHIQKGYSVLKKIADVIEGKAKGSLEDLSNEFYTLIPHSVGMSRLSYIKTEKMLKEKLQMVEALADIEVAMKMLKGGNDSDVNQLDQHYANLKCDMVPLEKKSSDFQLIKDYVKNTHGTTHWQYDLEVMEAFDLKRHGEDARYKEFAKDKNRMLLWHGSRMTNFVGIISQGLRIAPPEAPVTGYMFGKGVYFADMVSKSANYCFTNRDSNTGFMLLCDVALGDMHHLYQADYYADQNSKNASCLSTKGCGRAVPDPKGFKTLSDGTVVPCGKEVQATQDVLDKTSLQYNEFIVYNVSQIRARYLVKMKFKYK